MRPMRGTERRRWRCAAVLLALPLAASAADPAPAPLTIGRQVEPSLVADSTERLLTIAFERAKVPVVFKRLPLARSVEMANDGEIDGDLGRIAEVGAQYPNIVSVPTPVNWLDSAVCGADPALRTMTRAEVRKLRVVYARGTLALMRYTEGMASIESSTRDAGIEMVLNRRVDITVAAYTDVQPRLQDGSLRGLTLWPCAWATGNLYLALNRRHAALVPRLDAVLQQMQHEGLIEREHEGALRQARLPPLKTGDCGSDERPAPR